MSIAIAGTREASGREETSGHQATVCQVLHSLNMGGAETLAVRLARRLQSTFRFVFVCLEELGCLGDGLQDEGFPVYVLGRRAGLDWRCARRLYELLRQERVDIIHSHQYTPFFYGLCARLMYRRAPVLFTEHGRFFPDRRRPKRVLFNHLMLERRDRVVGVGEAVRQALIHNEGIRPDRVGLIYNGVDPVAFSSDGSDRERMRAELGVEAGDLVILQVARLVEVKDHGTAIRALARVVSRRPDSKLVLVGDGPEEPQIRSMVQQSGLVEHVSFLGLRTDVSRLLSAADIFLLTSLSEGIPVTLIEAMAAERPVVATRVGGVGEVVDDGVTGYLAPCGDDGALAESLLRLAGDPGLRARMARLGRLRSQEMFSEIRMHDEYLRLYREMTHV